METGEGRESRFRRWRGGALGVVGFLRWVQGFGQTQDPLSLNGLIFDPRHRQIAATHGMLNGILSPWRCALWIRVYLD